MLKYFNIEGFENLIRLLDKQREYNQYTSKYKKDIEELEEKKCYDYSELESGDYTTTSFKIKVIERYITSETCVSCYYVEVK